MIGTTLLNRYRLDAELGRGGMGTVYHAHDVLLDRDVAIKVLSRARLGTEGRARLVREAQAAARLNHPNIVTVHDVSEADGSPFIVMELIEGQALRAAMPLSLPDALHVIRGICLALEHAHSHGVIHRDLKPENVMLLAPTPAPFEGAGGGTRVKLMDFGLARSSAADRLTEEGTIVGTVSYLAPESAMAQDASPQSDLYSFGVMMYELTAHRLPFTGDTLMAVVSQHLYAPVVPPSTYNAEIPPALDALIARLLGKQPAERPASATEVRQALDSLEQPSIVEPSHYPTTELSLLDRIDRGKMVGRQDELKQLQETWRRTQQGHSHLVLISGEPGIGKTRLARELMAYVQLGGAGIMRGGCYEYEATTPYLPFGEALRDWVNAQAVDALRQQLGTNAFELAKLAPEIEVKLGPLAPNPALPPSEERLRLFDHIARFLQRIASTRGLLLFVDDLHWADTGTLALLHYVMRRLRTERVMILAAYREVELDRAHPLANALVEWHRERLATRLPIGRLPLDETRMMLATLFGQESISIEFAQLIHRETEGNPFFIEEVIKSLIEQGQIYREGDRWQRREIGELTVPQSVKEAIGRRLNRLSDSCTAVLRAAAALGKLFEFKELEAVVDTPEDQLLDAVDEAIGAQLIRGERGDRFVFTHDKIREVLYEEMNPIRRRRLHQRIGDGLAQLYMANLDDHAQDLAHHFIESGDCGQGIQYAIQAAEKSARLFAHDEALHYYDHARECADALDRTDQLAAIHEAVGNVYYNRGSFQAAVGAYHRALDLASSSDKRAELKTRMGVAYAYVADERGVEFLQAALAELNPTTQINELARATAMLGRFHHHRREIDQAIECLERARQLAEPIGDADTLTEVYAYLAGAYQQDGQFDVSDDWARRCVAFGEGKPHPHAVAAGYEFLAENAYATGRWSEALAHAARDYEIGEKIGSFARMGWAENARANAHHGLGDLTAALNAAHATVALAEQCGDSRLGAFVRSERARIEIDLGQDEAAQADADFVMTRATEVKLQQWYGWAYTTLIYLQLQREQWEDAVQSIEESRQVFGFAPRGWLVAAYLGLGRFDEIAALNIEEWEHAPQQPLQFQAQQWDGLAQYFAAQHKSADAARLFERAITAFAQLGSRLDLGRAVYHRGLMYRPIDEDQAHADFANARSIFAAIGAARDLARLDRTV
jgi:serine/threonine protein kinase/tetratricopeptide (TPR) repeat protein